ncbi:MAG: PHP domain-containing protein [Planctomycetota bacterium]|jgi:predicted metal-dependent phosphoesterase TrpH
MHAHTCFSKDGFITAEALIQQCRKKQIDCVCITDHNTMRGVSEFTKQNEIKIIAGEEIESRAGEIIGLFLNEEIPPGLTLEQTVDEIKQQEGLVYLPHPFDEFRNSAVKIEEAEKIKDKIDFIEVYNSRTLNPKYNRLAQQYASDNRIIPVVGSDCHHEFEIGHCTMVIDDFDGPCSFLENLRSATYSARKCPLVLRLYLKGLKIITGKN